MTSSSTINQPVADKTAQSNTVGTVTMMENGEVLIREIGHYQIKLLRSKCIAAISCIAISPEIFALDEHDLVVFANHQNPDLENLLLSAQSCPTAAIAIVDTSTGEQLWPPMG